MRRLAIIHTTTATVEPLRALAAEILPDCEVINFVDDSILPRLAANGGQVQVFENRVSAYARFACNSGADVILEACSSIGELTVKMQEEADVPVVRIDSAMIEKAIEAGEVIGAAATLPTTLKPTTRFLHEQARAAGKLIRVVPGLAEGAYQKLMSGDREGHDSLVSRTLAKLAGSCDVVVLAQASMARVLDRLPQEQQAKFLTSPRLAMERVKSVLEAR